MQEKLGQPLYPGQVGILEAWAESGRPNALLCVGRRSGKTMISAGAAIFNAVDPTYSETLLPGAPRDIIVVANSEVQAGFFIREARRLLEGSRVDPRIYAAVNWDACRQDLISFVDGVSIRAMPLSSRSTRGPACSMLIFDESGHFQAGGEGVGEGDAVYQALAPTVAQFGDHGHIMFTSTPKLRMGLFWDQYRNGVEGKDPDLFVIQRATWEVSNDPNLTREKLEKKFPGRPEWVATEYGADFMLAAGSFLNPEDVYACQRSSGNLPPAEGIRYSCAIDPAYQRDTFAMGIAHKDGDVVVVDGIWGWNRQGYDNTLDHIVSIAKQYNVRSIRTDQFASEPIVDGLRKRQMACEVVPWANTRDRETNNKWDAFSRLKTRFATQTISIPNDPAAVRELINLLAGATKTGLVTISAPSGEHDDRATVLAALMAMLDGNSSVLVMTASWDPDQQPDLSLTEAHDLAPEFWEVEPDV